MNLDLHESIAKLRSELKELRKQREYIEKQTIDITLALGSLARFVKDPEERGDLLREIAAARRKPAGLTETISQSLRQMPHTSLSGSEVRAWLEREGFDLSDYSQPLATILVTLGRLAKSGRVKATRRGRKVSYRWVGD
jgi:hypothetical protein